MSASIPRFGACTHGCAPAGPTGPATTAAFPAFTIYDPDDLLAVRNGSKVDYTVEPRSVIDLERTFGIKTAPLTFPGAGKYIRGFYFDPVRKYLFVLRQSGGRLGEHLQHPVVDPRLRDCGLGGIVGASSLPMREAVKAALRGVSFIFVLPALISFFVRGCVDRPRSRARGIDAGAVAHPWTPGSVPAPGISERARLPVAPQRPSSASAPSSRRPAPVSMRTSTSGPGCFLGLVHIERDVLIGSGVHITSGRRTHGTDDAGVPIREQEGSPTLVRIGAGAWIGSAAVVMADVGANSVVGAGAVVTSPIPGPRRRRGRAGESRASPVARQSEGAVSHPPSALRAQPGRSRPRVSPAASRFGHLPTSISSRSFTTMTRPRTSGNSKRLRRP